MSTRAPLHRAAATLAPAAALALALTACGGTPDDPGSAPPGDDGMAVLDGTWQLVEGDGPEGPVPIPDQAAITLDIDGADWGGTAACNSYGGTVIVDPDGQASIDGFAVTEMACPDPGVMEAEAAYLAALTQIDTATRDGGQLVLTGPDTRLRFAPEPPVEEAALIGTPWRLDALVEAPADDGADTSVSSVLGEAVLGEAVLELGDDGRLAGSTGCNRFSGSFELDGDELLAGPLATTRMACDDALTRQEQHVLAVLDGTSTLTVEGTTLTIVGDDGRELRFRAGP